MPDPDEREDIGRLEAKIDALFPAMMSDEMRSKLEDGLRKRILPPGEPQPAGARPGRWPARRVAIRWAALAASVLVAFVLGWQLPRPTGGGGRGAPAPDLVDAVLLSRPRGGGEAAGTAFRAGEVVELRLALRGPVLTFVMALTHDLRVEPLSSTLREVTPESSLLAFKLDGFAAGPLGLVIVTTTGFRSSASILSLAREAAGTRLDRSKRFEADLADLVGLLSAEEGLRVRAELLSIVE